MRVTLRRYRETRDIDVAQDVSGLVARPYLWGKQVLDVQQGSLAKGRSPGTTRI